MSQAVVHPKQAAPTVPREESLTMGRMMWRQFRKHRLALLGIAILGVFLFVALFAQMFTPYNPEKLFSDAKYVPPQVIRFRTVDGQWRRPFVYGWERTLDLASFQYIYQLDTDHPHTLRVFVQGYPYKLLGLVETNIHLFGFDGDRPVFLFGSDSLGRDVLSRIIYGARISLSIALLGVWLSLILGLILGGISGFVGGTVDDIIQRVIELLRSVPTLPLWMALAAAIPADWPLLWVYVTIVAILSLISWTGVARVIRGKFLSLREEEYVLAAQALGASTPRIIAYHLIPNFLSYIIVNLTLSIPSMILAETSLSYLGLGLRPPAISWGVLLQEAQSLSTIAMQPWLLLPGLFVIIAILALNFIGDGLRDAADPYQHIERT